MFDKNLEPILNRTHDHKTKNGICPSATRDMKMPIWNSSVSSLPDVCGLHSTLCVIALPERRRPCVSMENSVWFSTVIIVVSWGCHNKSPQTGWLKTTQIYSLSVLGVRRLKSSCQQGPAPSDSSREDPSFRLPASGGGWQSLRFLGL